MYFGSPAAVQSFWNTFERAASLKSTLQPLPPSAAPRRLDGDPHFDLVRSGTIYQREFGGTGAYFAEVPLESLVPIQTNVIVQPKRPVNTPAPGEGDALLHYCLPVETRIRAEVVFRQGGVRLLTDRPGIGSNQLCYRFKDGALEISLEHLNLFQVRRIGNRNLCFNGSHRAVELLSAGHSTAMALVIEHGDMTTVPWPQGRQFWSVQTLMTSRPPLFTDFLSEIAIECPVMLQQAFVDLDIAVARPDAALPAQIPPIAVQMMQQLPSVLKVA